MKIFQTNKTTPALFAISSVVPLSAKAASGLNQGIQDIFKGGTDASLDTFKESVINLTDWGMNLAGALVILVILYAAILYLTAQGDEAKAETAKKTIIWAAVGAAFVALSKTILLIIKGHLNA